MEAGVHRNGDDSLAERDVVRLQPRAFAAEQQAGRAELSPQEVRTMRGVVTALAKGRGRVLAKLAARTGSEPK